MNLIATDAAIGNWIDGKQYHAATGATFEKWSPHDGELVFTVARSGPKDVEAAVDAATRAQPGWAAVPAVHRGHLGSPRRVESAVVTATILTRWHGNIPSGI